MPKWTNRRSTNQQNISQMPLIGLHHRDDFGLVGGEQTFLFAVLSQG
jgi:hypothetical protein